MLIINKKITIILFTMFIAMALPMVVSAQIDGVPGENVDAPIDGGLSLLVAAGVGYGAKKLKEKRKGKLTKE